MSATTSSPFERSGLRGVRTGVTGDTTIASELSEDTTTAFERVAPAALLVLLILLWFLLRSWAAPLYLVGSSLLVVATVTADGRPLTRLRSTPFSRVSRPA